MVATLDHNLSEEGGCNHPIKGMEPVLGTSWRVMRRYLRYGMDHWASRGLGPGWNNPVCLSSAEG